jgi:hypothetical protein
VPPTSARRRRWRFDGGREKAPAAICRKVIAAQLNETSMIAIAGDGDQTEWSACARRRTEWI